MTALAPQVGASLALDEFKQKLRSRDLRVAVVGFGYVGTCIGAVLVSRGFAVTGVDPDDGIVEGTNAGRSQFSEPGLAELLSSAHAKGLICATSDVAAVAASDVVV